jgi:hypothetical protein
MKFILNFLFRRLTVDSIVASFDKTIAKLDTVQQRQTAKVQAQTALIVRAAEKRTKHADEATRAAATAERFKRLVRGDEPKNEAVSFDLGSRAGTIKLNPEGHIAGVGIDNPQFGIGAPSLQVSAP